MAYTTSGTSEEAELRFVGHYGEPVATLGASVIKQLCNFLCPFVFTEFQDSRDPCTLIARVLDIF